MSIKKPKVATGRVSTLMADHDLKNFFQKKFSRFCRGAGLWCEGNLYNRQGLVSRSPRTIGPIPIAATARCVLRTIGVGPPLGSRANFPAVPTLGARVTQAVSLARHLQGGLG